MPQLIINADDFGLTTGVNRSIEELHRAGVLTSATLMATGAAFDDAIAIARRNPNLAIGCHILLAGGQSILPATQIPSLASTKPSSATNNALRSSLSSFYRAAFSHRLKLAEVEREAIAQIAKIQSTGIPLSHVDTHKHTHLIPAVAEAVIRAAHHCGIHAIRNPFEQAWSSHLTRGAIIRRGEVMLLRTLQPRFLAIPEIRSGQVITSSGSIGVSATGTLDARTLARLLAAMPSSGTWELVCHPGYNDADLRNIKTRLRQTREVEMRALLNEVPKAIKNGLTLASYHTLITSDQSSSPHIQPV